MSMRTVNDPYGGNAPLVDKMIGTAFVTVQRVACALEEIKYVVDNMQAIVQVAQADEALDDIAAAAPAAVAAANAAVIAANQATALLAGILIGLDASGALVTPTGQEDTVTLADVIASIMTNPLSASWVASLIRTTDPVTGGVPINHAYLNGDFLCVRQS